MSTRDVNSSPIVKLLGYGLRRFYCEEQAAGATGSFLTQNNTNVNPKNRGMHCAIAQKAAMGHLPKKFT
jgi:hypothetical protein